MKTAGGFFNLMRGSWKIKKTISGIGSGFGFADFRLRPDKVLQYREDVKIKVNTSPWHGRVEHQYKLENGTLSMQLTKQEKYHPISFEDYGIIGIYPYAADTYQTLYGIDNNDAFYSFCQVTGSREFDIITEFTRMTNDERMLIMGATAVGHSVDFNEEN